MATKLSIDFEIKGMKVDGGILRCYIKELKEAKK